MVEFPAVISQIEFIRTRFVLELQEPLVLDLERLLRLRRDLRASAKQALTADGGRVDGREAFMDLFDPPLSEDPVAVKRFQRPGPAFVLQPDPDQCRYLESGDQFTLQVHFFGKGMDRLAHFAQTLQVLGQNGLHHGEGRFELVEIQAEDASGATQKLWHLGQSLDAIVPALIPLAWWFDRDFAQNESLTFEFVTPARLLSQGKPLFRPRFSHLFPFILRRVSSMIHAQFGVEVIDDARRYQEIAAEIEEVDNRLFWQDWRFLEGSGKRQDLGGVKGSMTLAGESLRDISWLLCAGALMNLGKNASFGAGHYRIFEGSC